MVVSGKANQNLHANSLIALDAWKLENISGGHFSLCIMIYGTGDLPANPNLVTTTVNGKDMLLVAKSRSIAMFFYPGTHQRQTPVSYCRENFPASDLLKVASSGLHNSHSYFRRKPGNDKPLRLMILQIALRKHTYRR